MLPITINPVTKDELPVLHEMSRATFITAFGAANSTKDMRQYLDEKMNLNHLTKEWENPESYFYFARNSSKLMGYLKLNTGKAQNETLPEPSLEVERIYVLAQFQGQQIGQQLLNFALEQAKERQLPVVWLGVWEHNQSAQRFYKRNGFQAFSEHAFYLGEDKQTDILMRLDVSD